MRGQRADRVRRAAAVAAGMQVLGRAGRRVTSSATRPRLATVIDGRSARHMAPSAETTRSQARRSRSRSTSGSKCGLPDLLLAFDQHLEVDRQPARRLAGTLRRPGSGSAAGPCRRRRRAHRGGRRGSSARRAAWSISRAGRAAARRSGRRRGSVGAPGVGDHLAEDGRMAAGLDDLDRLRSRRASAGRATKAAAAADAVAKGRIGADARDAAERLQVFAAQSSTCAAR